MRRVEFVGPQVGEELREDGGLAMLIALAGILIYVSLRFEWRFALGSVAALVHDVLITLGFFTIFRLEFDLTVLAALLAVIGYSLNDTIVVFDRIRENFRKIRRGTALETVNVSLNQTLSRTIMTSLTTLLVLIALYTLGGELIRGFATALIIGVLVGTYSSSTSRAAQLLHLTSSVKIYFNRHSPRSKATVLKSEPRRASGSDWLRMSGTRLASSRRRAVWARCQFLRDWDLQLQ